MKIALLIGILCLGFLLLIKGSDFFVDGSAGIATRFGIPQLIIGLTIVAMGTSAPEAAVSITAASRGSADIAIGNIVGSNILNVFIILGIAAVIVAMKVEKSTIKYEIPYMIFCSVILLLMGLDGKVGMLEGVLLWGAFLLYLAYLFIHAKKNKEETTQGKTRKLWLELLFIAGGMGAIILGSKLAVDSATELARIIGVSERYIGLTIVALGTSLPELFTSVNAARKGNADIAIGNIVGSNIFNILFVIGTTGLVTPVPFAHKYILDSIVMIAAGIILLLCVIREKKLTRPGGIILLVCYGLYFAYLCIQP